MVSFQDLDLEESAEGEEFFDGRYPNRLQRLPSSENQGEGTNSNRKRLLSVGLLLLVIVAIVALSAASPRNVAAGGIVGNGDADNSTQGGPDQPSGATSAPENSGPQSFAVRDERCSPTGSDKFSLEGYSKCGEGTTCVATRYYSQCVDCSESAWQQDCFYWSGEFRRAAFEACPHRATCEETSDPLPDIDDACSAAPSDQFALQGLSPCRRGLRCVTIGDHSQCVDCSENWQYDCPYWTPEFLSAAQAVCEHQRECPTSYTREQSCGAQVEEGGMDCDVGMICVSTAYFAQCVDCSVPVFHWDCDAWAPEFRRAAEAMCGVICTPADAPAMTTQSPTASPLHRARAGRDEVCAVSLLEEQERPGLLLCQDGLECVVTEYYSQCVSCDPQDWEEDCPLWSGEFYLAALDACADRDGCAEGPRATAHEDQPCSAHPNDSFAVDGLPPCSRGLQCVVMGDHSQCVDCEAGWEYDCPYWTDAFLLAAQVSCGAGRSCDSPPRLPERQCRESEDGEDECPGDLQCLSVSRTSQCIDCSLPNFNYDCSFWGGRFLESAELACGETCEPEEYPFDLTRAPTGSPTRYPTSSPTRWPTVSPTQWPTVSPTRWPTVSPTQWPTALPTE